MIETLIINFGCLVMIAAIMVTIGAGAIFITWLADKFL